uniref:Uncharacterized protein n=1 Tax=Globisporangium ultimum (strain ATCC 200006 / CBS 805.95 / DAOM BR144) TaxID=431595 RepID=K3WKF9_GLOUD
MDLYADLPLAKGASSAALDANGNVKTSASSVWKTTTAPAFVPQVMRNAQQQGRGRGAIPPAVDTKSVVNMVPAALRTKSPHGAPAAATFTAAKKPSGISLAFKPASITRKPAVPQFVSASIRPASSSGDSGAAPADNTACTAKGRFSQFEDADEPQSRVGIGMRGGLGFATVTEVVRIQPAQGDENQHVAANENAGPATQSFQANYRDEYNPARPNSYEVYCEERLNKKKMEQVKRELERRQREQERAGKLERERLVRDIAEGKAPAIDLPAAGRGRGMTMPAWMRKKMYGIDIIGGYGWLLALMGY